MEKIKKMILCLLIMFVVIGSNVIQVYAAEGIPTEDEESNYVIGYIVPTDSVYSFTKEGVVTTNGLNLRKEPHTNSTILEVMYFGDVVKIDLDNSTATFYYVERNTTKTKGYASRDYIQIAEHAK